MSYTAHTWTTGETITAERMNQLEQGVAATATIKIVPATWTQSEDTQIITLTKTWQEVYTMMEDSIVVITYETSTNEIYHGFVTAIYAVGSNYFVDTSFYIYTASSANGYPQVVDTPQV